MQHFFQTAQSSAWENFKKIQHMHARCWKPSFIALILVLMLSITDMTHLLSRLFYDYRDKKGQIHVLSLRYFVRCQHYWCWLSRQIRKSTLLVLTLQACAVNLHCNHWPLSQLKFIKINEFYTELLVSENQHYRFVMLILWFLWYCEIKQENLQCSFPGSLHSEKNQQCQIPRKLDFVKILQCWILKIRASVNDDNAEFQKPARLSTLAM